MSKIFHALKTYSIVSCNTNDGDDDEKAYCNTCWLLQQRKFGWYVEENMLGLTSYSSMKKKGKEVDRI